MTIAPFRPEFRSLPEDVADRHPADADQGFVHAERISAAQAKLQSRIRLEDGLDSDSGHDLDPALLQRHGQTLGDFFILERDQRGRNSTMWTSTPKLARDRGKFTADHASADNGETLGQAVQLEDPRRGKRCRSRRSRSPEDSWRSNPSPERYILRETSPRKPLVISYPDYRRR